MTPSSIRLTRWLSQANREAINFRGANSHDRNEKNRLLWWARCDGRIVRHSPRDMSSMDTTACGSTVVNRPSRPVTNSMGMKAMTVVITDVMTDGRTSVAACANDFPCIR